MISVSGVEKSYGDRVLFENATFQLNSGERYGLVGANGSGKTTLLQILTGDVEATAGSVSIPKRLRVGALRQDQFLYDEESILNVTLMGNPELWDAMLEKEKLLHEAEKGGEFPADRFSELEETVQRLDGYTAEARAGTILEGLGIPADTHRNPIRTLSGGFKLRVLLAQVLAGAPDILLLDEPTNHLDILSIRWLETFLTEFKGPVVVISHDIRFLDNVATHILDVDYLTVQLYRGNYTDFMQAKVADRERREKDIAGREREIADLQRFVDRFKAKASKARQAQSKAKVIERRAEEMVELPNSSRRWPTFRFTQKRDSGKEVLSLKGIRKSFAGKEVLHGVDLTLNRGDRLAILGPNGIGKSTLLKIAMGRLAPDTGEAKWGYETHVGYFAQDHRSDLAATGSMTAEEWLWKACPDKDRGWVRGRLGLVLFSGDDGAKQLESLSGGEAARLVFARIALENPNVLVLDEPTNHLDLESIEALVDGLKAFEGTLVFVSHDRWFVGQLATRMLEIRPGGIRDYQGTYEEYVHYCGDDHLDADAVLAKAKGLKRSAKEKGDSGATGSRPAPGRSRAGAAKGGGESAAAGGRPSPPGKGRGPDPEEVAARIEAAETRIREIDALFCAPGFFERTPTADRLALERERAELEGRVPEWMALWEESVETG